MYIERSIKKTILEKIIKKKIFSITQDANNGRSNNYYHKM